ncbi:secretion protein HlyD family protein [Geobacter metallireducens RCH3]|uniref:Efflux pump, RND family, membrane fusion protein n=1 Tax=Geobacter metallireducens (strain ATCC 53774 / DSM 7210 / GS-15) TaxID=269799 RepID=Q39XX3_GEOMG|nr:HlyD family efflux transporter periplasmic adaptor subunit [Geobacter metallireducens]ABB30901.1 efflux pump, RND family, membrane fusion protein [Geobacter metallireducens GS-15]EHP84796.1 secretion protein HlyD family protein [Geobacter metallireducens RCH3]
MKKKVALIAILLLAVAAIAWFVTRRTGNDSSTVAVSGTIELTEVEVSFKIPGRVRERLVDEGELVKAGQVVARLDDDDLRLEVAQRERDTEAMAANLRELETGFRKEDIVRADAAVNRVKAETDRLKADFARQEALFRRDVISRRDYDAAKAAHESSQAALREAVAQQELMHRGPRKEQIDAARARFGQARETLELARTRLGYTTLAAPMAGLVLAKHVEPGEQVAAGTPIISVGDMPNTWMRAYIAETDLGRVKVGQKARVKSDTWPDRRYEGTVTFISPEAEFTPKSVQTEKERVKLVYRIKITIPNPAMELKPGMPVDAEIGTGDQGPGTGK